MPDTVLARLIRRTLHGDEAPTELSMDWTHPWIGLDVGQNVDSPRGLD